MNFERARDAIKSIGPDDNTNKMTVNSGNLSSDESKSSNIVNITSVVSDESNPRAIEDKTVSIPKDVGDQIPSMSISSSPPHKTKEIIPYIPNVPKI